MWLAWRQISSLQFRLPLQLQRPVTSLQPAKPSLLGPHFPRHPPHSGRRPKTSSKNPPFQRLQMGSLETLSQTHCAWLSKSRAFPYCLTQLPQYLKRCRFSHEELEDATVRGPAFAGGGVGVALDNQSPQSQASLHSLGF